MNIRALVMHQIITNHSYTLVSQKTDKYLISSAFTEYVHAEVQIRWQQWKQRDRTRKASVDIRVCYQLK